MYTLQTTKHGVQRLHPVHTFVFEELRGDDSRHKDRLVDLELGLLQVVQELRHNLPG